MITIVPYLHITEDFAKRFYLEEYLSHLKIQGLSSATIQSYIEFIARFVRFSEFQDYKDFSSFVKIKFGYYALSKRDIVNASLLKYYKCIKKYSEFLRDNELVDKVLINQIPRVRVSASLPKSLSDEEVKALRKSVMIMKAQSPIIQMRNALIIETFLYTGVRREELARLRKDCVFPKHIIIKQGKGGKDRIIYIPEHFSRQIHDWMEIQDKNPIYVFCDKSGLRLTGNTIGCLLKRIEKHVGFKVHPHLLRHTYASICVKSGINLYTLQQQMGHTSLKTTSIYLYLNSKENFEEMQKLRI